MTLQRIRNHLGIQHIGPGNLGGIKSLQNTFVAYLAALFSVKRRLVENHKSIFALG